MKKMILKGAMFLCLSTVAFIGISYSHKMKKVSGENAYTTVVSLGIQASAYCNEARYWPEVNNGKCNGAANDPNSRCQSSAATPDCTNTQLN